MQPDSNYPHRTFPLIALAVVCLLAGSAGSPAQASEITFFLDLGNSDAQAFSSGPYATVTLTEVDVGGGQIGVKFTVQTLLSGFEFSNFGFNSDVTDLVLSGATSPAGGSLAGPGQLDGFGTFDYIYDTGLGGGPDFSQDTFMFTVVSGSGNSVSISNFLFGSDVGSSNQASAFFAGHLVDANQSGFVAGSTVVPEPASLFLFGSGLAGLGLLRRRRNRPGA